MKTSTFCFIVYTMQKLSQERISNLFTKNQENKNVKKGAQIFMVLTNEDDQILEGYVKDDSMLDNISHGIKEIAFYFNCIHIMTRMTLCNGN